MGEHADRSTKPEKEGQGREQRNRHECCSNPEARIVWSICWLRTCEGTEDEDPDHGCPWP